MRKMMFTLLLAAALGGCGGGSDTPAQAAADDLLRPLAQSLQSQPQAAAPADSGTSMLRVYQAFYGGAPGYNEYSYRSYLATAASLGSQYAADFSGMSDDALAAQVLANVGISLQSVNSSAYSALQSALAQMFAAYGRNARGQIVANLVGLLGDLESNATFGAAARSFNAQVSSNASYASSPINTASTRRTSGSTSASTGSSGTSTGRTSYQAAYDTCYVGTPALYSSTYCQAYANAIAAGSSAADANQAGADAARSNVGNVGMGVTVSSTGTANTHLSASTGGGTSAASSTSSYAAAFNECYNGTPALYSMTYCDAYATARSGGSSASAANLAGAQAAGSNVGNVGTGQPISATGTASSSSTASTSSSSGTSTTSTTSSTGSSWRGLTAAPTTRVTFSPAGTYDYQTGTFTYANPGGVVGTSGGSGGATSAQIAAARASAHPRDNQGRGPQQVDK
jgi:hypothetical protein